MGGTAGLSEAEIKTVKHRQEYEKHLKAKEERLDRHSGECRARSRAYPTFSAVVIEAARLRH